MAVMDRNGRLFGRINIIDACALAVAIAVVPASLVAYRALRMRPLVISAVRPHKLTIGSPMRVQLEGSQFRPFLEAYVGPAGKPFILDEADRGTQKGIYMLVSPALVEVRFPVIPAGTYDLYLADHGRIVANSPAAITVSQPDYALGVRTMKVQFYPPPEAVPLIRVGDKDIVEPKLPTSPVNEPAVVTAVDPRPERREVIDMHLTAKQESWYGQPMLGQLVEVTLRLPQSEIAPNGWYYNDESVLVGGLFMLTTDRYKLRGVVTWMSDVQRIAPRASGQ
jgi:hypothetical protein